MAFHNANFKAINLPVGTYTDLGNGISAATPHQVVCLQAGTITIEAIGGGAFTYAAAKGDKFDVMFAACTVASGEFVAFKARHDIAPNYVVGASISS